MTRGPYVERIDVMWSDRRVERIEAGLTQPQLAQLAGVSERTVRAWEQGYADLRGPRIEEAIALAKLRKAEARLDALTARAGVAGLTRSTETGNAGSCSSITKRT